MRVCSALSIQSLIWRSLLALLCSCTAAALRGSTTAIVVVVVVVMACENALSQFLLSTMDICIELVAVLSDRELLVIINGYVNTARADRLILGVVELCYIRVTQGLLSRQPSVRVELK